ncbi:hypothetical protein JCM8547_008136 [Rhodosporidiobolus lusitaniae]
MPGGFSWVYKTTLKQSHPSPPSLALSATAPSAPSKNATLASSSLLLHVRAAVNDEELDADQLEGSSLAREVHEWLHKNRTSLGLDGVSAGTATQDGLTFQLNAFSRSERSSTLVSPSVAGSSAPEELDHLDLLLTFRSPTSSSRKKTSSQSQSQPSQSSQTLSLTGHILHPSAPLHFTLAPLLTSALEKLAKKLVLAFSLCFNSKWADRLTKDLHSHRSIASSLSNILNLSSSSSFSSHNSLDPEVANAAALAALTLTSHLSPSATSSSSQPNPKEALEKALLVVAKEASAPDAWVASKRDGTGVDGEMKKKGKEGKKRSKAGKKEDEGAGGGKKRKRLHPSQLDQDDQDDLAALSQFDALPQPASNVDHVEDVSLSFDRDSDPDEKPAVKGDTVKEDDEEMLWNL